MAIEIEILSGSQQGRCLQFAGDRILVGDVAVADVRFDSAIEAGARGKNAAITLHDGEGWRISNLGAGVWFVNQTAVESSQTQHLQSEDLVRVSEAGPDFFFRIVAKSAGPGHHSAPTDHAAAAEHASMVPDGSRDEEQEPAPATAKKTPVREAGGESLAPLPPPKKRRRMRKVGPLARLIGVLVSGLLGLVCAYGIACWVGEEKNDVFHVFYKKPPAPQSPFPPSAPSKLR